MHRFYLTPEEAQGQSLKLSGSEAHHALHVLRARQGDRVVVLDGKGGQRLCEVKETQRACILLQVLETHQTPPPPYRTTLVQALPKAKMFEAIVQKATELGVSQIVPLLSERVVAHLDERNLERKAEKWQDV